MNYPVVYTDVVIIGGGPAGLAAALALYRGGVKKLVLLEREESLGGILRQCIHDGFGLMRFDEALTGPEYADCFTKELERLPITYAARTFVTHLSSEREVTAVSRNGLVVYRAKAVVLATGCRERTQGALGIPGERPSGVLTAGVAQSYLNLHNAIIGREAVILGSGDIGLIMARRLTLEGVKVLGVYEIMPYPNGLERNVEQCLHDYGIPLFLSKTVTDIHGASRIEGVTVSKVDENLRPLPGSEEYIPCDTLVLSVGLIPENELALTAGVELDGRTRGAVVDESYQTSTPGVFAAGNALHVHDLADYVSEEAEALASAVIQYLNKEGCPCPYAIHQGPGVRYTVPQKFSAKRDFLLSFRVERPMLDGAFELLQKGRVIYREAFQRALPAQMVRLAIQKEWLSAADLEVRATC